MPKLTKVLVSVHVPVIFNGKELKATAHAKKKLNLGQLCDEYIKPGRIDVRPPYQRDGAWPILKEKQYIASCFSDVMPVPPMYVCKKNARQNCVTFWALDCRQRITAIQGFISNRFKVPVVLTYDNGTQATKKLYWEEICRNPEYAVLKQNFLAKEVDLVIFDHMDLDDQRKVFTGLNNGVPLNIDEQIYCNYFLGRKLCNEVFDTVMGNVKGVLQSSVRDQKRFRHVRSTHEILILCGGVDLMGEPGPVATRKQERLDGARKIHEKMKSLGFEDYDLPLTQDILVAFNLKDKLPTLKAIADVLADVLTNNTNLMREVVKDGKTIINPYVDSRNVVDVLTFLYKQVKEKQITVKDLQGKKVELVKFLKRYHTLKPTKSLNQSTTDFKVMEGKFDLLKELFFSKTYGLA